MELVVKKFNELTLDELWEIYKIRTAVFVVEQECIYQEVDEGDKVSYHIFFRDEEGIQAYLRLLPAGATLEEVAIGRVMSLKRRQGIASKLVLEAMKVAVKEWDVDEIALEAQVYAKSLYANLGFVQVSEEFLEDGIPHIKMVWKRSEI